MDVQILSHISTFLHRHKPSVSD